MEPHVVVYKSLLLLNWNVVKSYIQIHDYLPQPEKKSIGQLLYSEIVFTATEMLSRMCKRQDANKIARFYNLLKQSQFRLHYARRQRRR